MSSRLSLRSSVGFYGNMAQVSSFAGYTVVFSDIFSSVAHLAVDHNFYTSSLFKKKNHCTVFAGKPTNSTGKGRTTAHYVNVAEISQQK